MIEKFKTLSWKSVLFWISLAGILLLNIYIITYFNERITKAAEFRDKLIALKCEGSLSENIGFLTVLIADISAQLETKDPAREKKIDEIIEKYLLQSLQPKIMDIKPSQVKIELSRDSNIEREMDTERLKAWLNPEIIAKVSYKQLNLVSIPMKEFSDRQYLQTPQLSAGNDIMPQPYVFVPTQLVDSENGEAVLSNTVKREIIYSKIIENDLRDALKNLKDENINQAYFISISGFIRLVNRENEVKEEKPRNYYDDMFRGLTCFSDRSYFPKTFKEKNRVRKSNLYLDSGGFGSVYTYSIAVTDENLNIVGMIGLDRKVEALDELMAKLTLSHGSTPRDFEYKNFELDKGWHLKLLPAGEIFLNKTLGDKRGSETIALMKNPDKLKELLKGQLIAQIPDSSAYLLHIAPTKLAFFYFDPLALRQKYLWFQWLYILSLACFVILTAFILRFNLLQVIARRVHFEVVNHLNGGLVIIDDNGVIRFHNRQMAELMETSTLERKNFLSAYMDKDSKAEYEHLIQKSGKGFEFSGRIRRDNGTEFPAIISGAAVDYPGVKNARMLIVIPSETLERTIAARFIHSFSHALKTPAASILLLADRLRRKKAEKKFDHYYSLLKQQVDEFTIMVTNLLGFSKLEMEEPRAHKEQGNLAALLRGVVKPFKEIALKTQVEVIENIPERLIVDYDRNMLRIILNNLMENALKYTPTGKITVDACETTEDVVISFKDTGYSVPEDEREKIFEKFYRGKQEEIRTKDGIGIGLYLSRRYAELHNGAITYEPVKDELKNKIIGSLFVLKIPRGTQVRSSE